MRISLLFASLCTAIVAATPSSSQTPTAPPPATPAAATAPAVTYLDQGWDANLREQYYFTPQGSRLMPYAWFLALEQAGSENLFVDRAHLARLGLIYADPTPSARNPDGLPIGFTQESDAPPIGRWVGMTCAACHTGNVTAGGKTVRIDGAPAMADFTGFLQALTGAVQATFFDDKKFERFAGRVLGLSINPTSARQLKGAFADYASTFVGYAAMRMPTHAAGPGRVDALTQIVNSLSVYDLGVPENFRVPNAPVSYPFLWLTPQLDWVQWAPIATNPIGRNAGEVLGVFGKATLQLEAGAPSSPPTLGGKPAGSDLLKSTILFKNLHAMELWLQQLKPPRWQEDLFGRVDLDLGRQGAALFARDCRACHNMPPFAMTPKEHNIKGLQFIKIAGVNLRAVGTDPTYNLSLVTRLTRTGDLAPAFGGRPIVPGAEFFGSAVDMVVKRGLDDLQLTPAEKLDYSGFRFFPPEQPGVPPKPYSPAPEAVQQLKAGPLLGIWATGPFLHNGSVPNIDELLSAPEARSKVFWVGSNELDAAKLGFVSTERNGLFRFDTAVPGNGNGGHRFPATPYAEAERKAVIEYLKDTERFAAAPPPQ